MTSSDDGNRVPSTRDGAIDHLHRCGLTLATIADRPDVNEETIRRIAEATGELDSAVSALRRVALSEHVAGHALHADESETDPAATEALHPFPICPARDGDRPRRVAHVFYDLETNAPIYYDDDHTEPVPVGSRGPSTTERPSPTSVEGTVE